MIKQYLERGSDLSTLQRTTLLFGKTKFGAHSDFNLKQLKRDLKEVVIK